VLIWITGISGAGKTTLARRVHERLKRSYPNTVYIDGDEFREAMGDDVGHTLEGRDKNAQRITGLCRLLCSQGIHVVCGVNLTSQRFRDWCRENIPGYFEVYLEVPMDVLVQRDRKGLYAEALAGRKTNVVGVDIPAIPPKSPDLIIDNSIPRENFDDIVDQILKAAQADA
jgi:adenylylsulfate kinase-like enzyme